MAIIDLLTFNLAFILACVIALWGLSLILRDVTFMDAFWALGLALVGVVTYLKTGGGTRAGVLVALASLWAVRLAAYLLMRWRREGPDPRYVRLIEKAREKEGIGFARAALTKVFLTQAPMLWIVSLPVQLGQIDPEPTRLGILAYAGVTLAVIGLLFETVGDWQLMRFRADPQNRGRVLDSGLWRYTRHPNYFGDACVWWGLYMIAAETPVGLFAIPGPVLLTWTLIRWSGAATLERRMKRSRPDYVAYVERTSTFLPWPPKHGS